MISARTKAKARVKAVYSNVIAACLDVQRQNPSATTLSKERV